MDDLSDVIPNAKFHKEFPLGYVPVRHVAASFVRGEGALASLEGAYTSLQAIAEMPVRELEEMRVGYLHHRRINRDESRPIARAGLVFMMRSGMTLRQVALYVEESLQSVVAFVTHQKCTASISESFAERLANLDEELRAGTSLTHSQLGDKHGFSRQTTRAHHAKILPHDVVGQLDQAAAWVSLLKLDGWGNSDVVKWVRANLPAAAPFVDTGYAANRGRDEALAKTRKVFDL